MRATSPARLSSTGARALVSALFCSLSLSCQRPAPAEHPTEAAAEDDDPPEEPSREKKSSPQDKKQEETRGRRRIANADAERARREREFARELLSKAPTPQGQHGVVFAVGQRTADLPWTLALENRSEEPFVIAADMHLLELTLIPPSPPSPPVEEAQKKPDAKAVTAPQVFGVRPKIPFDDTLELAPSEMIVASFDPRDRVPEDLLVEGTEVQAAYGYAVETEIRWERGKRVERALTEKPPFVLTSASEDEDSPARTAKVLTSAPFMLGETYPLSKVSAVPRSDASEAAEAERAGRRESPLKLTLADLGAVDRTFSKVLQLTLKNQTREPLDIVVKRELFSFEVIGPQGATTCVLEPMKVDPLAHNFTRLTPGASRSLPIRLPEACPAGTFDVPGQYRVMARFVSPSSGAEYGKSGFVGIVRAEKPARLTVNARPGQPPVRMFRRVRPKDAPSPGEGQVAETEQDGAELDGAANEAE